MRVAAVILGAAALVLFAVTVLWRDPSSEAGGIGHQAAAQLWLPLAVVALLFALYERFIRDRLTAEVAKIAAPSIVGALPPEQVMESFLESVYGANNANRDVIASVLGNNLTVSTKTEVELKLSSVSDSYYRFRTTTIYDFSQHVMTDRFVLFVTCDARLRDSIAFLCDFPLFELWFLPDRDLLQNATTSLAGSAKTEMEYVDKDGQTRRFSWRNIDLREVKYNEWPRYLPLFRDAVEPYARQHARDYLSTLRIFEWEFAELPGGPEIQAVTHFGLRQSSLQLVADRFCYWQVPYPCFVDHIDIDVSDFNPGEDEWQFNAMPFCFRASNTANSWLPAEQLTSVELRSWLLPGHGIVLLWRPAELPRGTL